MVDTLNAFGERIAPIQTTLDDPAVREYVQGTLADVLRHIGLKASAEPMSQLIISQSQANSDVHAYEKGVHATLAEKGVGSKIGASLQNRAQLIYSQIGPYVHGKVCDIGCGDGKVGKLLSEGKQLEVMLVDVYQHPQVASHGLPFAMYGQGAPIPIRSDAFDTSLLLTVLHHSDNPTHLLQEARRITRDGGRIVLIESVYGVQPGQKISAPHEERFLSLSSEQQRTANIFFDHFYNRVLHYSEDKSGKVNVPFNFSTPSQWDALARQLDLEPMRTIHLGIDQKTVPEYHTLHVLNVIKS